MIETLEVANVLAGTQLIVVTPEDNVEELKERFAADFERGIKSKFKL
jgi:translation initiation factor IF-2